MAERFYPGWGLAVLRAVWGAIFLMHGLDKFFTGDGVAGFAAVLEVQGFPWPGVLAWLVAGVELLGGLFLLVGWLTRWVAAVLFVEMLVAMAAVHLEHGFFVFRPAGEWGYEYNLALLAGLASLVLAGGGRVALDEWLPLRYTWVRR